MADFKPGNPLFDIYRIDRLIDTGTYGEVLLVTHLQQNAPRVVKILQRDAPGMGSSMFQACYDRFKIEAQLGTQINHPRVVKVHELHEMDAVLGLAMEYAPRGSLADRLRGLNRSEPGMKLTESARIILEVAEGLAVLHERDIVHRNLTPRNILFDQHGSAKVADLGLAQITGAGTSRSILGSTMDGSLCHPGTIGYESPEQINTFDYLSSASDVYALGLILFEMLVRKPYHQVPVGTRLKEMRSETPHWLDDLAARMLDEERNQRPWDGAELVEILKDGLAKGAEPMETSPRPEIDLPLSTPRAAYVSMEKKDRILETSPHPTAAGVVWKIGDRRSISLDMGVVMELVHVPDGEFLMGSDDQRDRNAYQAELPLHKVFLPEYWIGRTPVTNQQYQRFVEATRCNFPIGWKDGKIPPGRELHPVVNVSWEDAKIFCLWLENEAKKQAGQFVFRLPSEAEWEKAARGTDVRIYPWGDRIPDEAICNFGLNTRHTTPVGKYSPLGDSPYGCADMVGNTWEWTADWFSETYYQQAPVFNPGGPEKGTQRALRGGSWISGAGSVRLANRGWLEPEESNGDVGFRCVMGLLDFDGRI